MWCFNAASIWPCMRFHFSPHGTSMMRPWELKKRVDFALVAYACAFIAPIGLPLGTGFPWCFHDSSMAVVYALPLLSRCFNGISVVLSWDFHGSWMVRPWWIHGSPMILSECSLTVIPRCFHVVVVVCPFPSLPRCFHGISMVLPWEFSWFFLRVCFFHGGSVCAFPLLPWCFRARSMVLL